MINEMAVRWFMGRFGNNRLGNRSRGKQEEDTKDWRIGWAEAGGHIRPKRRFPMWILTSNRRYFLKPHISFVSSPIWFITGVVIGVCFWAVLQVITWR